jgi:glycosyltransferase involved in cell wall biosynthesis
MSIPPLRVALATMSFRQSGAEKQFVYMARVLRNAGVDVRVFHLVSAGYYYEVLRELGIPLVNVSGATVLARLWRLCRAVRRFSPHIVQANHFGTNLYATAAARCCRALAVGAVRSSGYRDMRYHGRRGPWLLRLPDAFVVNSHPAAEALRCLGVDAARLWVVPNAIDFSELTASAPAALPVSVPPNRVLVAAVGRLAAVKRLDLFLAALARAVRVAPSLCGVVIGEGPCREDHEAHARRLGLSPSHVVFLGHRPDAVALLRRMSMLVLSSDEEGFPNVLQEAMAQGVPVISTPAGEAARLVQSEKTGLRVDYGDAEGMAAAMVRLATDTGLAARMGEAARAHIHQEYRLEMLLPRLLNGYSRFMRHARRFPAASGPELWRSLEERAALTP